MVSFILDFFFGPCINNSAAVDNRQQNGRYDNYQKQSSFVIRQHQMQRQYYSKNSSGYSHSSNRSLGDRSSNSSRRRSHSKDSRRSSSKRLAAIAEDGGNLRRSTNSSSSAPTKRDSGSSRGSRRDLKRSSSSKQRSHNSRHNNTGSQRIKSASNGGSERIRNSSGAKQKTNGIINHKPKPKPQSTYSSKHRRDDATVMSVSLFETSTQFLNDDDVAEQIVIQRSLKDVPQQIISRKNVIEKKSRGGQIRQLEPLEEHIAHENGQSTDYNQNGKKQSSTTEISSHAASHKSELESYIDMNNISPEDDKKKNSEDYDNVTTISKASKNPYRVLGISQSASPHEIYSTYKRKMQETEERQQQQQQQQHDGSDDGDMDYNQAFDDVDNAYRRLKADIQRQEARTERLRLEEEEQEDQEQQQSHKQRSTQHKLNKKKRSNKRRKRSADDDEESIAITRRDNIDARLKDHRELVQGLFANDNKKKKKKKKKDKSSSESNNSEQVVTLQDSVSNQSQALAEMNLVPVEAGQHNINEDNETINNSCFYLSLAASYLSGSGSFAEKDPTESYFINAMKDSSDNKSVEEMEVVKLAKRHKRLTMKLALQLKRTIEAAVLLVHPDWAKTGQVGEEVQAFSDFLVYALDSDSVLGHWAIAVFDEASGFTDVYRGRHYGKIYPPTKVKSRKQSESSSSRSHVKYKYKDCDDMMKRANTLTLRYIPGHYQPLLPELTKMANSGNREGDGQSFYQRAMLEDILSSLEKWSVLHVVTDGRA